MKNFVEKIILVCFSVAVFIPAQSVIASSFNDVLVDNPNYDAIEYLKSKNIISGYSDGSFGPDKPINRAEASKIIDNAFNIDTTLTFEPVFPDVKKNSWFFPFVMAGKQAGFIKGYTDGNFQPGNQVKLSETLKMVLYAGKCNLPDTSDSNVLVDVSQNDWVSIYALYAKNHNIILADKDGKIFPNKLMTRGAFSEIVYRTMTVLDNKEKEFPLYKNWALYDSPDLPFNMKYDANYWELVNNNHDVVFYHPDDVHEQFSSTRIYPNTGRIEITIDRNETKMSDIRYFSNIKTVFKDRRSGFIKIKDNFI